MKLVVVESPYAGDVEANVAYARRCLADSLRRGEAPFASHLLYTQSGVLDDQVPEERDLGMQAGFAWGANADTVAFYVDRGISDGMLRGLEKARICGIFCELRAIDRELTPEDLLLFCGQEGAL